jgi:hypothetical protein
MKITKAKIITLILVCASVFVIGQTKPVQDTRRGSPTYGKYIFEGKVYNFSPFYSATTGKYFTSERGQPIPGRTSKSWRMRKRPPTLSILEERIEELEKRVRDLSACHHIHQMDAQDDGLQRTGGASPALVPSSSTGLGSAETPSIPEPIETDPLPTPPPPPAIP